MNKYNNRFFDSAFLYNHKLPTKVIIIELDKSVNTYFSDFLLYF